MESGAHDDRQGGGGGAYQRMPTPKKADPLPPSDDYRVVPLPRRAAAAAADTTASASTPAFCSNVVVTSKYTAWNFLPLFLAESFRKLANAYFLLVSALQTIKVISNTNGIPSTLPALLVILSVDAMLAIIEDRRRHRADDEANSTECHLAELEGFLRCENPNNAISRFDGILTLTAAAAAAAGGAAQQQQQPVAIKNVILRGCQLRNTEWIYGFVINTGPETKIMQSSVASRPKWSSINETVNRMIIYLFLFLLLLCMAAATVHVVWMHHNETDQVYLGANRQATEQWFVTVGQYLLLMYQMIPVSLYVTMSVVLMLQAVFIARDIGKATLRRRGVFVPDDDDDADGTGESGNGSERPKTKPSGKAPKVPFVNFEDDRLLRALERDSASRVEAEFFLHLSLCHTVIPEAVEGSSEVRFSASSPDEQALVSAAKYFGFSFESRGLGVARVRLLEVTQQHLESFADDALRTLTLFPTAADVLAHLEAAEAAGMASDARQAVVIDGECLELTLLDDACRAAFLRFAMRCAGELFNRYTFFKWLCSALFESAVVTLVVLLGFNDTRSSFASGALLQYGVLAFTCVVIVANLKVVLWQMSWTALAVGSWVFGIVAYVPATLLLTSTSATLSPTDFGGLQNTLSEPGYWLAVPMCVVICLLRHFAWTAFQRRFKPQPWQIVQESHVLGKREQKVQEKAKHTGTVEDGKLLHAEPDERDFARTARAGSSASSMARLSAASRGSRHRLSSSSGFAYSYDQQTAVEEAYMVRHSARSASEAEPGNRPSRGLSYSGLLV
ncbi:hypothetical protein PybrP1_002245 [[Pythium] brassicae (nom. inval.)]|nr:hypothetical protein PybrP1_002245 [[Pythium] brassicae (nom. inval.)]